MPGYDPVRDAGGSDRSSPPPQHYHPGNDSRPSSSASAYPQQFAPHYEDPGALSRSLSGNSFDRYDRYGDDETRYRRPSVHESVSGPPTISPRSSFTSYPAHLPNDGLRAAGSDFGSRRHDEYHRNSLHAEAPQPPARRSASIADLVAVSEMSEAEHDRHREAHRWSQRHGDELASGHGMSRSSSASGGFHTASASEHHSFSQSRISPHQSRQMDRSERSPSMAHLLNEGTAGALQDRPRSSSHSSITSHVSHPAPHQGSQMSPLGAPTSSNPGSGPGSHIRDRSVGSQQVIGGSAPYRVGSPSSMYAPGTHSQSLSTLNRGGSSPGLTSSHFGHPAERARFASHSGSVGHGQLPRSASNSYAHVSASSSPASNAPAHLQPSPSHRFAVPEIPYSRSPETRRVPLPQSPTTSHNAHPRTVLVPGPAQGWHTDENEASSSGMPPPSMSASPRRGSLAGSGHAVHRYQPPTPGTGIPTTPGSVASLSGYPITPGSRSMPPHTPHPSNHGHPAEAQGESNYFPPMEPRTSLLQGPPGERRVSLTSPHLRQLEHATQSGSENEARADVGVDYDDPSAAARMPLAAERPARSDRSSVHPLEDDVATHSELRRQSTSYDKGRPHSNGQEAEGMYDSNGRTHALKLSELDDVHGSKPPGHYDYTTSRSESAFSATKPEWKRDDEVSTKAETQDTNGAFSAPSAPRASSQQEDEGMKVAGVGDASPREQAQFGVLDERTSARASQRQENASVDGNVQPFRRYAPTRRVSQPRQVMRPIGIEEIDRKRARCRNPLRLEWEHQHQTDSREPLDEILRDLMSRLERGSGKSAASADRDQTPVEAKKRGIGETLEDAEEVANHYNKRREVGIHGREESPIIALRKFNNWVKSVLVGTFARGRDPSLDGRARARGGRVLDLGCGKGGDLRKWEKVRPSGLVGADIAAVSIEQAIARHRDNNSGFAGDFFAFDCFSTSLAEVIPRELLEPMFDNVTLQFCMHYAWEGVDKARMMLDNVARYLRKGGVFIGTIPDSRELRDRMAASAHPEDRSFGNRYYKVIFDQTETWPAFGNRYTFFLEDAVENVPEYVVDFDVFEELAYEVGLRCIYRKNFAEIYHDESRQIEFGKLLDKMRVVDRHGSLNLDEDMWEAATVYLGFAFEKM